MGKYHCMIISRSFSVLHRKMKTKKLYVEKCINSITIAESKLPLSMLAIVLSEN